MAKRRGRKKKKSFGTKVALGLVKVPYYLGKGVFKLGRGVYRLAKKSKAKVEEKKIREKRESLKAIYKGFDVLHTYSGEFDSWNKDVLESDSTIGIIVGARGSGKSAFGVKFLENYYAKTKKKCYSIGFRREEMPSWIRVVENVSDIKNDSFVLIDEGGILFSSRRAMSKPNKLLGDLILIARHKNLSILFITQNSSNLDVNIIRQADYIILKPSSLLQKDFERKKIKQIYDETAKDFRKFKNNKGLTYIYSDEFRGFINNLLPSFWNVKISKSFSGD